jgi:hypothetical protein
MRTARVALVLMLLVSSLSLSAGELVSLGADPMTLGQRLDQLRAVHERQQQARRIAPNVVSVDWEKEAFIIPVAGSVQGGGGTFFRSDVTIANRRLAPQIISVGFMFRGQNNGAAQMQRFQIDANTTTITRDFIANQLHTSGLGTLLVIAVDSAGNTDEQAEIDGFSRIWTPQPGSAGSVSQSFEAIDLQDSLSTSYAYGLRQDSAFRTNVGLVNLYSTPNTFTIFVNGTGGNTTFTQTVQPYSMEQVSLPAGAWGDLYLRVSSADTNFNWWSAYGTSVDNVTGDGWVSHVH